MSLFKIKLENGELYKSSKGGRVQHYMSQEKAEAKIKKLGDIAVGATVVESKARTSAAKIAKTENPEEIATDIKVAKVSRKKSAAKAKKTDATDVKVASSKAKKAKKNKKTDD